MRYTETLSEAATRVLKDLENDLEHLKSISAKETRLTQGAFLIGRLQSLSSLFIHLSNADDVLKRIKILRDEASEITYEGVIS
ncbi:hypothetical protein QNH23_06390 [Siminovitchia fortis]|uniref:Uncharacterized protein n=1 Tax=Siminovitchia fortis TaxID=254758 RepID=A0A443IMM2_9BACI|nr:hypothetical protein [Siminovitchia fortis]RWR06732.1 hypothetical protein D4N35_013790 [Siminovitchia fortis]WHY83000.1 hypothetical protein QNH23_06390 [Siminovitchia fortis]